MLRFIMRHVLAGLMTILPVMLTLYLLYWFAVTAETLLGNMIRLLIPAAVYWPGMGLAVGLLVAFVIGLLMRAFLVQRLFAMGEQLIYHTPFIKSVYRALRDFLDYLSPGKPKEYEQVVAVTLGEGERRMQVIGLITQNDYQRLPEDFRDMDSVLVYIPMSYMIGGFAVLMPRSALRPLNMSMDEAMRFILTAGVTTSNVGRYDDNAVRPEKDS